MNGPIARLPIYLPLRCPIDNGQLELTTPTDVRCVECGAGTRKITRETERLKAVVTPEHGDIEKAARRLHRIDPEHGRVHWDDLTKAARKRYLDGVKSTVKTLKEGLK
jgi:hypothetical protein